MEHDQTRGAEFKSATLMRLQASTKYGLGIWLDRRDESGQGIELSSPGAFSFRPWIDRKQNLFGVFVVEIGVLSKKQALAGAGNVQDRVREIITKAGSDD
jgi:hypothetical protein